MPRESRTSVSTASRAASALVGEQFDRTLRERSVPTTPRAAGSPPARRGAAARRRGCLVPGAVSRCPGHRPVAVGTRGARRHDSTARRPGRSSSARSRAPRNTSPTWAARPAKRRSSTEVSGTSGRSCTHQDAQLLRVVPDRQGPPSGAILARRVGRATGAVGGQVAAERRSVVHDEPDLRPLGPGPLGEHLGHPGRAAPRPHDCPSRSRRTRAGRRTATRSPPWTTRDANVLEARLDRIEGQRDHGCGEHRKPDRGLRGVADQHAAAEHDDDVDHQHEGRESAAPRTRWPATRAGNVVADRRQQVHPRSLLAWRTGRGGGLPEPRGGAGRTTARPDHAGSPLGRAPSPMGTGDQIASAGDTPLHRRRRPQEKPHVRHHHHRPPEHSRRSRVRASASSTGPAMPQSRRSTTSASARDRPVHRHHGPVRLGQVDAVARARRPRPADARRGLPRRHRDHLARTTRHSPCCAATGSASSSSRSTCCPP